MADAEKSKVHLSPAEIAALELVKSHQSYLEKVNGLVRTYADVTDLTDASGAPVVYETPLLEVNGKTWKYVFSVKANYDDQGISETMIVVSKLPRKTGRRSTFFAIDREIGAECEKMPSEEKLVAGHNLIDMLIVRYAQSGLQTVSK